MEPILAPKCFTGSDAALLTDPEQLDIHNAMATELWKEWEEAWMHYARAIGLNEKEDIVQVSTLLTVIGPQARRVIATFQWEEAADKVKIRPVLTKCGAFYKTKE